MLSPLALAMLAVLSTGTTFPPRLLALGGAAHIESVAADVDDVARRVGVDPAQLGALLIGENERLDPDAVSQRGLSAGLPQLRVGLPNWEAWRNACRALPSSCRWVSLLLAARVLREALDRSGGRFARAVVIYRFGVAGARGVKPRKRDLKAAELAARIRALMGGAHG